MTNLRSSSQHVASGILRVSHKKSCSSLLARATRNSPENWLQISQEMNHQSGSALPPQQNGTTANETKVNQYHKPLQLIQC